MEVFHGVDLELKGSFFETGEAAWKSIFADMIRLAIRKLKLQTLINEYEYQIPVIVAAYDPVVHDSAMGYTHFADRGGIHKIEIFYHAHLGFELAIISALETVIHEFVHVHQILSGIMNSPDDTENIYWDGIAHPARSPNGLACLEDYLDGCPWEQDAFFRTDGIMRKLVAFDHPILFRDRKVWMFFTRIVDFLENQDANVWTFHSAGHTLNDTTPN